MEVSKSKDPHPSDDVSHACPIVIKPGGSDTPDSNKGLQDHDSVTDSPKITKPVLGKAQAKKRLMAFANKFRVSPVLKAKEKDVNVSKNQTINLFSTKKKSNSVKDLMEEVKVARNRIESELDFQEQINDTSSEKKNYKKHKKKSEPKISAIEEIIREESKQKMLLANVPDRIYDNSQRNEKNDRSRNFVRFSQWGRKNQQNFRRSNNFNKGFGDRQFNDRRRHNNGRRDRSRSHDRREGSHNSDKRRSVSPEVSQKTKVRSDKLDKVSKKGNKHREKGKGSGHKDDDKKEKKNESYYPNNCESWKTFKSQGGRIRERSLSDGNYEHVSTDVKCKTAEEYNGHLEQMLMIGSHRLERSYAVADGKNDDRKPYPPESIRVTKCKGPPIFYCENPEISLFLFKEQLLPILPSDHCSLIRKITDDAKEIKTEEKEEKLSKRKWFKKWKELKSKDEKETCEKIQLHTNKQEKNISSSPISILPPKSKWDSEDESVSLSKDNTPSDSQEDKADNLEDDFSSAATDEKLDEPEKQIEEKSTPPMAIYVPEVDNLAENLVDEKIVDEISENIDKINDVNSPEVREKLISEYEQFIKIVSNNTEEFEDSKSKDPSNKALETPVVESSDVNVVNDDKTAEEKKKNNDDNDTVVDPINDEENIINFVEIKYDVEEEPHIVEDVINEKLVDKNKEDANEKSNASDWEYIRDEVKKDDKDSNREKNKKDIKRRERKKINIRKEVSSSESSNSSSSSLSDSESEKCKKKRSRKKRKIKVSSSDSSSSESECSSSDDEDDKKKRKRNKRKSRKKSRTKKKRMKKENTDSESSYSDDEEAARRKKKRRKDSSKHRKTIKRRSKSVETRKVQRMKKEEKINLQEEILDESNLDKLKKKIVLEANSLDKDWPKDTTSSSQKSEEIGKAEAEENKEKLNKIGQENSSEQTNSVRDSESYQPSPQNKAVEKDADIEGIISDNVSEKADQSDGSKGKKLKKKKNKRRSSSTSSSSSISSNSSSSSLDSKSNIRDKKQKKERSKRKSGDLSSRLMKKFKKYHSKLSSSLDFNALHFPSLTQLEQKISKNISVMDDWEVDSQDGTDEFIAKSKDRSTKKEKKVEKEVRYDSKTDTYIAVEKKSQRENKKKQAGPVCALRIWEDEEEEGEREAIMLMKEKMETETKLKPWEPNVESPVKDKIIVSEEPKPIELPAVLEEKEEEQTGWVEIIPEGGVKPVEVATSPEIKKPLIWTEQSPDLKDDSDENLVPVNWEEEEVEWIRTLPGKNDRNKLTSSNRSGVSSDSSSDSSDSSSSSDSSDSEGESSEPLRSQPKASLSRGESPRSGIASGSKEFSLNNSIKEPSAETEAMKKLRMNMFAEFAAKESHDGFSDQHDSIESSEIPLMVSRIPSLPISLSTNDDSKFVPRAHEIDSTAEREAIRRGFRDFTPRSDSRSSSHDSRRRFSPRRDREKLRIRNSEERASNSSHRSESRGSIRDSSKDRGRKDDRSLRGHSFEDERKYSPLSERDFREKRRSPVPWKDKVRSRSRSWSRSRSKSPHRRDDRLNWDRYKRSNYADDRRGERFSSRSPPRGRSPFRRDRGKKSPERARSRERSRDRAWSRDKSGDRSYDHPDFVRNGYDIRRKCETDVAERGHWREDSRAGKETSDVMYVKRPPLDADFDDRIYHRNNSLDRDINNGSIDPDFDKSRYKSRSRSRERRSRDLDWDRSRESTESDKFCSRNRKTSETRLRSRLSPKSRSPSRSNRTRGRSRSSSWSRSRTYSRSRSRSVSRNRSRSRSSSRSRSRVGLKSSDRPSRFRRSRSLSPHNRRFSRIDENRFRRSTSRECGRRIETIIHPSGINPISLEEPSNISEANLPSISAQFEYSYYQGNNLTYPPRLDNANPPSGSPKRLSLDDRLELELGIKKPHEPSPVPLPYNHPKYNQLMLPYPGAPEAPVTHPRSAAPQSLSSSGPIEPITGSSGPSFHCPAGALIVAPGPHGPLTPPAFNRQHPTVVQVGNVLQVVPGDFSGSLPPAAIRNGFPAPSLPVAPSGPESCNSNRVVRVGNVLQVVPTTTLDWSGRPPLSSGLPTMPTNTGHMVIRPSVPMAPYSATPVLRPNSHPIPAVSSPVPLRPQSKLPSTPPLPITTLPKLEPPKAPPVIQPGYNYHAIMEARRKEREERKQLRAKKRLEKKRKKMEKLKRRAKRVQSKTEPKTEDVETETIGEDEPESSTSIEEPKPSISEDSNDLIVVLGQSEQTTPPEGEEEDDDDGDVEEYDDDIEFGNEEEGEEDMSKEMSSISQQVDAEIIKLAENPDSETIPNEFKATIPLPLPPKKSILVPPGFWEERFIHDNSEETMSNADENDHEESNFNGNQLTAEAEDNNEEKAGNNENDKEKKLRTPRQRRARKSVQFADGVKPGEGTSPSGCEGDLPSPPPPVPVSLNDPLHEQIKRSRIRKNRKKAKRIKPMKIKKKVKVKIIKLKKPKVTPLQAMMMEDSDEVDDRSPPPPPPGSPPPPHLWPSYLAAYSATLRPADTESPSGNQAPPPPTPLPLLVPPPPLNYTIQPFSKI